MHTNAQYMYIIYCTFNNARQPLKIGLFVYHEFRYPMLHCVFVCPMYTCVLMCVDLCRYVATVHTYVQYVNYL